MTFLDRDSTQAPETRKDFSLIARWVHDGARVLDLGCGDGGLLEFLRRKRNDRGYGVEISIDGVKACVARGVNVLQRDLEGGLADFDDAHFDYVILSQTLQAMHNLDALVKSMLRVGREAIVTFPNFGYWPHRWQIMCAGRMPVSRSLPYEWYNTPNIHLCTVNDFDRFLVERQCEVMARMVIAHGKPVRFLPNALGQLALYRFRYRDQGSGFR